MSATHDDIMAEIRAMKMAMVVKDDLAPIHSEIAEIKTAQAQTKELVEVMAAVKTGSRAVIWMSKFTAGLIAVWVLLKGGAEFLVEIGKQ